MRLFKAIILYFSIRNLLYFREYKYIRSERGPRGLWVKFPRWHCCLYNQNLFKSYVLGANEITDYLIIKESELINYKYCFDWIVNNNKTIIEEYSKFPNHENVARKPFPGFNHSIYKERKNINRSPLAHFIESGFPKGPWLSQVIQPNYVECNYNESELKNTSIALHIHLYYGDMAGDIAARLKNCRYKVDLFISVKNQAGYDLAKQSFSQFRGKLTVRIMPNKGRDIAPLITGFAEELSGYSIIGHVHTKKSLFNENREAIQRWTNLLLGNTISSKYPIINDILDSLINNAELGLVFPDDPNVFTSDINKNQMIEMLNRMKLISAVPKYINFPAGTMFWAKKEVLMPLFDIRLSWEDYPEEPLPNDGTLLHALERCIPIICNEVGYNYAVSYTPGLTY